MNEMLFTTLFGNAVSVSGTVIVMVLALYYLRRVRLERPPVGVFNGRDIAVLLCVLALLPTFYILLPHWALTTFLAITFMASLSIGYRPVVRNQAVLWAAIGLLLGANIWMARTMLGTVLGWQIYWVETSFIVVLSASAVANLYVQGGMKLKHVARFAMLLAVYDIIFTAVSPLTNELTQDFLGYPLDPSFGFRLDVFNATIGIGDLLIYALFVAAAFKAYGRKALRVVMPVVVIFGAIIPATAPVLINFVDARADIVVPAQTFFGIGAYLAYRWLRHRHGQERTMKEFLASNDVVHKTVVAEPAPAVAAEPVPAAPAVATAAVADSA